LRQRNSSRQISYLTDKNISLVIVSFSYIYSRRVYESLTEFYFFLLFAAEIKAQVLISSLYITLSDIQSVKIVELPSHAKVVFSEKSLGKSNITILNPSASQIRKIQFQTGNTEFGFQQSNKGSQMEIPLSTISASRSDIQFVNLNLKANRAIPLVIYQIDPH